MRKLLSLFVAGCVCSVATLTAAESSLGRKIDEFSLHDFRGKTHALQDYSDAKLLVVAFVGIECPLAKLYAPRLQELHVEFRDRDVAFIAIDSNRQDTLNELAGHARTHGIAFPVLKDPSNIVADAFGAIRTPEVFLLDADRKVRYRGRIDDQYGVGLSSGYVRPKIGRRDLAIAIEELLDNKPVTEPLQEATGCFIGRVPSVEPHGDVTYSRQIARIMQDRCVSCHRPGEVAPFSLQVFEDVAAWGETISEVVQQRRMPPWSANPQYGEFHNASRLSDEERDLILQWVENGCPQGDTAELPVLKQFVEGWQIQQPDQVIHMAEEAYAVPAEGIVEYQYFTVDPGWTKDKWIQAAEARPGNRAVVHHIIVYVQPPGENSPVFLLDSIAGYAPGEGAEMHPEGIAAHVQAGSKLIFEMHYTPNGSPAEDCSYVGFKFADPAGVRKRLIGGAAMNVMFAIPPGASNHKVTSRHHFGEDTLLLSLAPHMHVRGKSFRFEAAYPDGKREILLDVPRYDFNWQFSYRFREPKMVPAGTVLHCTAHFDNSDENPANPDPTEMVSWGDQSWEEMMIGFFNSARVDENLLADQ